MSEKLGELLREIREFTEEQVYLQRRTLEVYEDRNNRLQPNFADEIEPCFHQLRRFVDLAYPR